MHRAKIEEAAGSDEHDVSGAATNDDDDDAVDDDDADDDDAVWSHGPPPQVAGVRFPVDGYPDILEELDWEDFGIAFKLAGPWAPGERTVLLGFHAMWLAPYGGRYRNAAVTIDQRHHAAHLWVDRFAVPCSPHEQVHHLLWVVSKLDEITPILHARFGGATMAQKYGGMLGDTSAPFVLGGNPLVAVHAAEGERGVDAWIAAQTHGSNDELAQMLRELAIELVTRRDRSTEAADAGDVADDEDDVDAMFEAAGIGVVDEDPDDADDAGDAGDADDAGKAARTRHLTVYAGELLTARASAGALDPRVAERLRPLLAVGEKYEQRRTAVVSVLGALRDRDSVSAMIRLLEGTPILNALDAISKADLLTATVAALGAIADPAAIPALLKLVAAPGAHNDEPRAAAASALAACLAAAPAGLELDDATFIAMARSIGESNDDAYLAEMHLAYGSLARELPPARREAARQRLLAIEVDDDGVAMLARGAALVLAGDGGPPDEDTAAALRARVHAALTELDDNHDATVRKVRIALRVAARSSELVEPSDLVWLTRLAEPDVRAAAHALLAATGHPMPPAVAFDRRAAGALSDAELVRWIGEPHVVGRPALVADAGRRQLAAARPAIVMATRAVIDHVREGDQNLLEPQARLVEAAVGVLRDGPLDGDTIALFDRMLRHANHHVKWELLQAPPRDERLIGGMLHVAGERWDWQETTAKEWLASYAGTSAYEAERKRAPVPVGHRDDDAPDAAAGDDDHDDDSDDGQVN